MRQSRFHGKSFFDVIKGLGVGVAELLGVVSVESESCGFSADRRPINFLCAIFFTIGLLLRIEISATTRLAAIEVWRRNIQGSEKL